MFIMLHSVIHLKIKSGQILSDSIRMHCPSQAKSLASCIQSLLSKNAIERVENVKSLGFYSRLFLVSKPHHGRDKSYQDISDSRVMGIVDRPIGSLPSHHHSPNQGNILGFVTGHMCSSSPLSISD